MSEYLDLGVGASDHQLSEDTKRQQKYRGLIPEQKYNTERKRRLRTVGDPTLEALRHGGCEFRALVDAEAFLEDIRQYIDLRWAVLEYKGYIKDAYLVRWGCGIPKPPEPPAKVGPWPKWTEHTLVFQDQYDLFRLSQNRVRSVFPTLGEAIAFFKGHTICSKWIRLAKVYKDDETEYVVERGH